MQGFLDIMSIVIDWLRNNGIPIEVGSFSGNISFFNIIIGVLVAEVGMYFLFRVFDY